MPNPVPRCRASRCPIILIARSAPMAPRSGRSSSAQEETLRLAALLEQDTTAAVILHGAPAAGKTSLVQAGLWPYLAEECIGYRVLCDRNPEEAPTAESDYPPLVLRPGSDLAGQLAEALFAFCASRSATPRRTARP